MDELDHNLFMAWQRVFERCRRDPAEARRRYERSLPGSTLDRPNRARCVAIRASDTRIDPGWMAMPSTGCESGARVGDHGGGGTGLTSGVMDTASCAPLTHEIVLTGGDLQRLGGPVWIDYPGLPIDEAAELLGKHKEALRHWLPHKQGRTRAARARAAKGFGYDDTTLDWQEHEPTEDRPLGVRYVPQRTLGRGALGGGMQTPKVWSDHALDPGAVKGRPPARWWGTLWMSMAQRIPAEFEQVLERVPRVLPYGEGVRHRGWWWRCPGIHGKACGRLVQKLYAPLPPWTVGRALGIEEGLEVQGRKEKWRPGVDDRWAGKRRLACETCWRVRRTSFTDYNGWNELVSYLSGGLLYGREVQKPSGWKPVRKRAYKARKVRDT